MTKLFKALGATLLAAGLVVAGVVAPSQAATLNLTLVTNPANTAFDVSSNTPEFTVTLAGASVSSTLNYISVGASRNGNNWSLINTCPAYGAATDDNLASCGISSIKIGGSTVTGWKAYLGGISYTGIRILKIGTALSTSTSDIEITFSQNAFVTPATNGAYTFGVGTETNGGSVIDSGTTSVQVGAPASSTITFNANGGTGVMASQSSSVSAALNANTFTRSGYTFTGWNTLANGNGTPFAGGVTYNFVTSRTLFAQWTAGGGGGGSSTSATLTINASTGQLVAGSSVAVVASGLQATAPYTVVVQSTPQTIGSGNATAGAVNTSVTLPAGLEAGWHTLTFTSTGSNGSAVTSVTYFKVSASGTLLATSSTIPAELANTGIDSTNGIMFLLGGLSLALIGAEMLMIARRKRSN